MIIIDTDVMIDILRQHPPAVEWMDAIEDPVVLPGYVVMELYQGCLNKREAKALEKQLKIFAVVWPDEATSNAVLAIHAQAHLTHAMGILDALIGATAKSFGLPIHSFNAKHFAGYPGLQVIEPYVR